jgi:hypothetical protein
MAMDGQKHGGVPAGLAQGRERFAAWRRKKPPRSRIPQALWKLAIELVGAHGLHRTARVLKLDYYSLKKQVELARDNEKATAFVEVVSAPLEASGECVIELEDGDGASMRVTLKGHATPDVAALVGSFWKAD